MQQWVSLHRRLQLCQAVLWNIHFVNMLMSAGDAYFYHRDQACQDILVGSLPIRHAESVEEKSDQQSAGFSLWGP